MNLNYRHTVGKVDRPISLNGPSSRRPPLRILFFHPDAADVKRCVQELRKAQFKVSTDVAITPEQFARDLQTKHYDAVLAEYPSSLRDGPAALEILSLVDRRIPCIFLTKTTQLEI